MYFMISLLLIGFVVYGSIKGRMAFQKFLKLEDKRSRKRHLILGLLRSWLLGVSAVLILVFTGNTEYLFRPISNENLIGLSSSLMAEPYMILLLFFLASSLIALIWLLDRNTVHQNIFDKSEVPDAADVLALHKPGNRILGVNIAIAAGVNEELFFRALLPVMFLGATHNTPFAIFASILLFGLVHLYQGISGVIATTIAAAFLTIIYIATGNIFIPIIIHAFIDIIGLIVRPNLDAKFKL